VSARTGLVAAHDGTEYFSVPFHNGTPDVWIVRYLPVPGGVVIASDGTPVFVPMCRLEYDLAENGQAINVHLTSTLPQLLMGAAMASAAEMQSLLQQEDGG